MNIRRRAARVVTDIGLDASAALPAFDRPDADLIRQVRGLRLHVEDLLVLAVAAMRADGHDWDSIAAALTEDTDWVREHYAPLVAAVSTQRPAPHGGSGPLGLLRRSG